VLDKARNMKNIPMIVGLILITSCAEKDTGQFDFLLGTWKVEGKEQYEAWVQEDPTGLTGHVYGLADHKIRILESLAIKTNSQQIIYEATVPDQNEGKTIPFILNTEIDSCFSFENTEHDFPKKIQYQRRSNTEIFIRVLGEEGMDFSYVLIKQ